MPKQTSPSTTSPSEDPLAIAAMILGAVSFTGLGFITGIPAIILASVALAHKTQSRGLSIAGLVTGIASTVLSVLGVLLYILLIVLAAAYPNPPIESTTPMAPMEQPYSQNRV